MIKVESYFCNRHLIKILRGSLFYLNEQFKRLLVIFSFLLYRAQ